MALKALMLRRKLDEKRSALDAQRNTTEQLEIRAAEIEKAIEEAKTEEEQKAVEEEVEKYDLEKTAHEEEVSRLEREIGEIEKEIAGIEERAKSKEKTERKEEKIETMNTRKFFGMDEQRKAAFFEREDVKEFCKRMRELAGSQRRDLTGGDLLIPVVVLDLLRERIGEYSKLYEHVAVKRTKGSARQPVLSNIPDAVWTEACATLNDLDIAFTAWNLDGYKVGGYVAVCNAVANDSDIDLLAEMMDVIGAAIGRALDKAIIYGTGSNMPMGIVTRLAQTEQPAGYQPKAPTWENLSASHMGTINAAAMDSAEFFGALVSEFSVILGAPIRGEKFFAMNEATFAQVLAKAIGFDAAGVLVAEVNGRMPVLGGRIAIVDAIADGDIVGGYGANYILLERQAVSVAMSEHAQFIEDNTVVKATARYDGVPAVAESFAVVNINNVAPTTSVSF